MAKVEKAPEVKKEKSVTKKESKPVIAKATAQKPLARRPSSSSGKLNIFQRAYNAIRRYISETIGELRKVSWPTRQEAIFLTQVVIVVIIIMSVSLGLLDFLFAEGIAQLLP